jgi:hypothetical protein
MKRIILAIGVLAAAFAAYFFLKRDMGQTSKTGSRDFALTDPRKVDRIFYSSKNGAYLTFKKQASGNWTVENGKNKYMADTASVNFMLNYVMTRLEVQSPVNDAMKDNVTREMAISGTKVQFFDGSDELKTFFVGSKTYDDLGTFMHLPGAERPCIVKIPGREGYVTPFFTVDIHNWRSPVLLDVPASDIKELEIRWNEKPENGFRIQKQGDELQVLNSSGKAMPFNRNRILAYLDMFTGITREAGEMAGVNRTAKKDSILRSTPFFQILITRRNGKKEVLNVHHIPIGVETYSPETREGILKVYETETYWGVVQGVPEIWTMQDIILKNRMKTISELLGS